MEKGSSERHRVKLKELWIKQCSLKVIANKDFGNGLILEESYNKARKIDESNYVERKEYKMIRSRHKNKLTKKKKKNQKSQRW